jgi:U3 small nucleolar RNA-associated protein 4
MGSLFQQRTIRSQGGAIWSLAVNPTSTLLALGCEDGSVHLLSLLLDTLTHHRRFDRVKSRLLSIAWGPPIPRQTMNKQHDSDETSDDDDGENWHDAWIVTGGSDSYVTKWDVSAGKALDRMKTDKLRGERTLVWAVGVLG